MAKRRVVFMDLRFTNYDLRFGPPAAAGLRAARAGMGKKWWISDSRKGRKGRKGRRDVGGWTARGDWTGMRGMGEPGGLVFLTHGGRDKSRKPSKPRLRRHSRKARPAIARIKLKLREGIS